MNVKLQETLLLVTMQRNLLHQWKGERFLWEQKLLESCQSSSFQFRGNSHSRKATCKNAIGRSYFNLLPLFLHDIQVYIFTFIPNPHSPANPDEMEVWVTPLIPREYRNTCLSDTKNSQKWQLTGSKSDICDLSREDWKTSGKKVWKRDDGSRGENHKNLRFFFRRDNDREDREEKQGKRKSLWICSSDGQSWSYLCSFRSPFLTVFRLPQAELPVKSCARTFNQQEDSRIYMLKKSAL